MRKAARADPDAQAAAGQAFRDEVDSLAEPVDTTAPLLEVEHLAVEFTSPDGWVRVIDDVSFTVQAGETAGLVGESGSGKSVSVLTVMGLLPKGQAPGRRREHPARRSRAPRDASDSTMRSIQGSDVAMIFQEPMTSLNPAFTIGNQIAESVRAHRKVSKKASVGTRRRDARTSSAFPMRPSGSTSTRTSSPAACGSGR